MKKSFSVNSLSLLVLLQVGYSSCALNTRSGAEKTVTADSVATEPQQVLVVDTVTSGKKKIKIALLLDTSNSMDGLIDQARAQLWKLVNELALARYGEEKPTLEIALYEYGNDRISAESGYVRQVTPFTDDLDLISEKLFSLRTNGGSEFCAEVISQASSQLNWLSASEDLQMMFIAGNESFHQGPMSSALACNTAKERGIIVNTIFCGENEQGISMGWKTGSSMTDGNYMCIDQDNKTLFIETPYDSEIAQLNDKLNDTYVNYGIKGSEKKMNQSRQDVNAAAYGTANATNRVVSKVSKMYSNSSWDLVDASKEKSFDVTKIKEVELPDEMKGKTIEQKKEYIAKKTKEREMIVKQIEALNVKRNLFISEATKNAGKAELSLDAAMIKAIRSQAAKKNFSFES